MPDPIPAGTDLAEAIVAQARAWIGTPYRHQASLRGVGCDCLGLLRGVWRAVLGPEPEAPPPYAPGWAEAAPGAEALAAAAGRHLVAVEERLADYRPRPGDVLLFAFRAHLPARHCAIATGPDAMVHAHDGAAVTEVALTPWWRRHLAAAFRFPASAAPAAGERGPPLQTQGASATGHVDQGAHFGGSSPRASRSERGGGRTGPTRAGRA